MDRQNPPRLGTGPVMIRFVLAIHRSAVLALGFIFLVHDGTKSIADQTLYFSSVGATWSNIHQSSLTALQPTVERLAGTWAWQGVVQPYFLDQPVVARARRHRRGPDPARAQEEAAHRLCARLGGPRRRRRGPAGHPCVAYLMVSMPALQTCPSCVPVATAAAHCADDLAAQQDWDAALRCDDAVRAS